MSHKTRVVFLSKPEAVLAVGDALRFLAKFRRKSADECWPWTASVTRRGYGQFGIQIAPGKQRNLSAHRVAWELSHGPIPEGMSVLHRCDVRRCVNPDHLFLGTHTDNMQDAAGKGRLHVPRPKRQKLTSEQLAEIDSMIAAGVKQVDVARRFDVSKALISLYLKGKRRQYDAPRQREQVA